MPPSRVSDHHPPQAISTAAPGVAIALGYDIEARSGRTRVTDRARAGHHRHGGRVDGPGPPLIQEPRHPRSVLSGEPLPCCLLRHAERLPDPGPADAPVAQGGHVVVYGGIDL